MATQAERTTIIKLTVAMFNAAPGAAYLSEMTTYFDATGGTSSDKLLALSIALAQTTAFKAINPNFQTAADFATSYLTPFGLQNNQEAKDFITAKFNSGANKGQIELEATLALANSSSPVFADARNILVNKFLVAEYFSVTKAIAQTNVSQLQSVIASVDQTSASVDAAKTAIDNGAGGNASTSFTLTTGVDNLVGTVGNDTFTAVIDNFGAATTAIAGSRTTLSLGDAIDGAGGVNTINISSNLTGASTIPSFTAKNIQIVNVANVATAADVVTIAASTFAPSATQFNATGTGSLTVTGIGLAAIGTNGVSASIGAGTLNVVAVGANTINIQATTVSAAAVGTVNIDVSGGSGTSAQVVTVNSLGSSANIVSSIKIGNTTVGASALTVNAAANLKTNITEAVVNTLKTVTISGAAASVDLGVVPSTALTSVDASGLTVGGARVSIGTNAATTFKGGAGNDTLTISTGVAMTGASDGGTGTNTLAISDMLGASGADTSLTAATASKFTNFQTLQVSSTALPAVDTTFDASLLSSVTTLNVAASSGGIIISNLAAAPTVNVIGTLAGTSGLSLSFKVPSATNADVVNLTINNQSTATSGNVNGLSDTALKVGTSVAILNIASNGTILGTGTQNVITTLTATDTGLTKVNITGAAPLSLTTGALTKSLTIDGSAATGGLTIDASGILSTTANTNINGGSANDTITSNKSFAGTETIFGGGGGDAIVLGVGRAATNIVSLVYKAALDSSLDATGTSGASGTGNANTGKMDAISGFLTGQDKIDVTAFNTITAQKGVADKGTFTTLAAGITAATASTTFFNDATNTQRVASEFHVGTDTYVIIDVDHNGVFNVALDVGIKLTGVAAVVAADFLA